MFKKFQALVIEIFGIIKYTKLMPASIVLSADPCKTDIIAVPSS